MDAHDTAYSGPASPGISIVLASLIPWGGRLGCGGDRNPLREPNRSALLCTAGESGFPEVPPVGPAPPPPSRQIRYPAEGPQLID